MAKKKARGSIWIKGKKKAIGYYVRKKVSGKRGFRLRDSKSKTVVGSFNTPGAARREGWKKA